MTQTTVTNFTLLLQEMTAYKKRGKVEAAPSQDDDDDGGDDDDDEEDEDE